MDLSIIIVNYKTPKLSVKCIESIFASDLSGLSYEIIMVDNNSNDGSAEFIKKRFKEIICIEKEENDGFGRANNVGIKVANGSVILFLNSDILVRKDTFQKCLLELKENPAIGALGCKLLFDDGSFQKSTYSIAKFREVLDRNLFFNFFVTPQESKVEALMGSFLMVPKKVIEQAGFFDPDFFMYSEEIELCHRIRKNGFIIKYFDKAVAIHKQGGSLGDKKWGKKQMHLSNALLFLKVRGFSGYCLYHFLFLFNTVTNFFAMWLLDKNYRNGYWQIQKAYFSNFANYLKIPFLYGRKPGNGKRMLRAN